MRDADLLTIFQNLLTSSIVAGDGALYSPATAEVRTFLRRRTMMPEPLHRWFGGALSGMFVLVKSGQWDRNHFTDLLHPQLFFPYHAPQKQHSCGSARREGGSVSNDLQSRQINTIEHSLLTVKNANSGHTGTAMALAPLAHVLFSKVMNTMPLIPTGRCDDSSFQPGMPQCFSTMLYLTGCGLELRTSRNSGSLAANAHPEVHLTLGVEVTTGPLGQGIANAVGMALAERHLRSRLAKSYQPSNLAICVTATMEGISHAVSLVGHQQLGNLVVVYDDNRIIMAGRLNPL